MSSDITALEALIFMGKGKASTVKCWMGAYYKRSLNVIASRMPMLNRELLRYE